MKHFMICVSGFSGVGKDEFCARLTSAHGAVQTGLADPAKRHMADLYGFTEEQLFGPSKFRNAGDLRYPKNTATAVGLRRWEGSLPTVGDGLYGGDLDPEAVWWCFDHRDHRNFAHDAPYLPSRLGASMSFIREGDKEFWLSPREALQKYCELMNDMYLDSWVRKGIEDQRRIASGQFSYTRMGGLAAGAPPAGPGPESFVTCFSDFRHKHEVRAARAAASDALVPVLVRIKSLRVPRPPFQHRSETEQVSIPDSEFDFVVHNDSDVRALHGSADMIMEAVRSGTVRPTTEIRL